jgi:outer membrane immunogenic protein
LEESAVSKRLISLFAATAFILGTSGSAFAADMPVKAPPPAPPPFLVATWTGFYVGLNAGGNWGTSNRSTEVVTPGNFFDSTCFPPISSCFVNTIDVQNAGAQKTDTRGFVGGGQVGYNWQTDNIVLGIETDFEYFRSAGTSSKTVAVVSGSPGTVTVTSSISTDWLYTLRPRLGWAVNNWLFYATGGLAVSNLKPSWTYSDSHFGTSAAGSFSNTKTGWTVGGGVEAMLPNRWVVGVEYLFVKFNNVSSTVPIFIAGPPPQNFSHSADLETNIVRARLSKLF